MKTEVFKTVKRKKKPKMVFVRCDGSEESLRITDSRKPSPSCTDKSDVGKKKDHDLSVYCAINKAADYERKRRTKVQSRERSRLSCKSSVFS